MDNGRPNAGGNLGANRDAFPIRGRRRAPAERGAGGHAVAVADANPGGVESLAVVGSPQRELFPPLLRLKAALVVAALAIAALAGVVYLDHRRTGAEQAVASAIDTYTAAWNAHDREAVLAAMTPYATFTAGDNLESPLFRVEVGPDLDRLLDGLFRASVSLETTGPIVLAGDNVSHASVPQRYRYQVYGLAVVEDGHSLFTLVTVDGTLKVAQHVWWRPRRPPSPSMLWAV
jgi:hypothetical protein